MRKITIVVVVSQPKKSSIFFKKIVNSVSSQPA